MKVILSTEDINSYGFWVLTAGIILNRFKKNPVVTLNHDKWNMSVGKINNIRVEGTQLVGEIEFDEEDEKGKELKRKYEKGYMNGFSIGIRVLTWSEDKKHLKEGQIRATAMKSELMEIAAATVPSNGSAVTLYDADGEVINLSAESLKNIIPEIKKTDNKMKEIALSLGLPENATEQEINAKIAELKAKQEQQSATPDTKSLAAMFLGLGVARGVITDENKADFEKLYGLDAELAVKMVDIVANKKVTTQEKPEEKPNETKDKGQQVTLSALLEKVGKGGEAKKEATWETLSDDEKIKLRGDKPEEYKKLFAAYYGYEPKLED
jgi:HK97 family phage prohead protease